MLLNVSYHVSSSLEISYWPSCFPALNNRVWKLKKILNTIYWRAIKNVISKIHWSKSYKPSLRQLCFMIMKYQIALCKVYIWWRSLSFITTLINIVNIMDEGLGILSEKQTPQEKIISLFSSPKVSCPDFFFPSRIYVTIKYYP